MKVDTENEIIVKTDDNSIIILSISGNYINFRYEDSNGIYIGKDNIQENLNITAENFIKNKDKYNFHIKDKEKNYGEINLKIKSKIGENVTTIALKCLNKKKSTEKGENLEGAAPSPNYKSPQGQISNEDTIKKLNDLIEKYDNIIKEIKKKNDILVEENEKLKKDIDEEKRKNDEIVKVFLENREKYELAANRNSDITKIYNKLG